MEVFVVLIFMFLRGAYIHLVKNNFSLLFFARDSEVAQIPALLLHHLKEKVPHVLTRIVKILSDRLLGNLTCTKEMAVPLGLSTLSTKTSYGFGSDIFPVTENEDVTGSNFAKITMLNLRTIVILPATSTINAEAFTLELQHSMTPVGSSVRLTSREF